MDTQCAWVTWRRNRSTSESSSKAQGFPRHRWWTLGNAMALVEADVNGWTCWNETRMKLQPQARAEQKLFWDLETIIKLFIFFSFYKIFSRFCTSWFRVGREPENKYWNTMRKVILVVFSPSLKVWRTHEKACPSKISTAEVHIDSSKYQTVCELLTSGMFLHGFLFKKKRDRDLNTISTGSGLISWEGGMPWAGIMQELCSRPHGTAETTQRSQSIPIGQRLALWRCPQPPVLHSAWKQPCWEQCQKRKLWGRQLWQDKRPWESGIIFNILGTRPCKVFL